MSLAQLRIGSTAGVSVSHGGRTRTVVPELNRSAELYSYLHIYTGSSRTLRRQSGAVSPARGLIAASSPPRFDAGQVKYKHPSCCFGRHGRIGVCNGDHRVFLTRPRVNQPRMRINVVNRRSVG